MGKGEIRVDITSLEAEIESMRSLLSGSGYYKTGELLSRGYGNTFDAINQMYTDLKQVEDVLMELISKTASALEKGGLEMSAADIQAGTNISSIEGEMV